MARVTDMTKGKPAALLLSFAFPLILGNMGQQLYMIVDAVIVGRGVGVKALAAVGATDWAYWLVLWTIQALTAAGLLSVRPMLGILKTPADIFDGSASYLFTMFAGTLAVMAYNMASAILRALGDGKTPLIAMGIAAGTNIALDLIFVIACNMGIVGAAAATLIAQLLSFLYCFFVIRRVEFVKVQRGDWKWEPSIAADLCSMGVPLALQHILIAIGGMILQSTINNQGFIFVAGFTATNKIYGILESSAIALSYSTTTYMAQNYGAKLDGRIRSGLKSAAAIGIVMSVSIAFTMILSGKYILRLFIDSADSNAADVLAVAYQYLVIMSALLFSLYLLHIFRGTLQGIGNATVPMASGIVEFVMRVSAALVFTRIWGTTVIFFAETLAWIGTAALVAAGCFVKLAKLPRRPCGWMEERNGEPELCRRHKR